MTDDNEIREDGHTLLLIEASRGQRTFKDYPNLIKCQEAIIEMYEECEETKEGLNDFHRWIDSFYMIRLFSLDKEISRYRMKTSSEIKSMFEQNSDEQLAENRQILNNYSHQNGLSTNNSSSINGGNKRVVDIMASDDDDDVNDEDWDS